MATRVKRVSSSADPLLTVGEVARSAEVDSHIVRFYVREGLLRSARVGANGYRLFVPLDVKRVRFIRVAQGLGFTLAEIREIFRKSRSGRTPCPLVRDTIVLRLAENRERLAFVQGLQERMQQATSLWSGMADAVPNGEHICALIEAVGEQGLPPLGRSGRGLAFGAGRR
jgi:DNA-binding transcriptional MerR regulator